MAPEIAVAPALVAGLLTAFGGFAALSQGMERHHVQVWGRAAPPGSAVFWRVGGAVLLFAAYVACVLGWGVSVGIVAWSGLASLAGLALVFALPVAPAVVRVMLFAAPAVGLLILGMAAV